MFGSSAGRGIALGLALVVAATLSASACSTGPAIPADHVVLVTIDTLRADHLDCYGYPRPTAPFLCGLAEEGVLFETAYSSSSHTAPSHTSMFTSLHLVQHKVLANGEPLDGTVYTVAEMFRDMGYLTAAFTSVSFLDTVSNGFDFVGSRPRGDRPFRRGDRTVDAALAWLAEQDPSEKVFVWVHLFDVHNSKFMRWRHPELTARLLDESPLSDEELVDFLQADHQVSLAYFARQFLNRIVNKDGVPEEELPGLEELKSSPEEFSRALLARQINQYDTLVLFADSQVRRLYETMGAGGWNDDALWVITADHGEGLGNHDFYGHGRFIYQEQVRVPLIFSFSGDLVAPARIDRLVSLVDIFPTLAAVVGGSLDEQVAAPMGRSLLGLITDRGGYTPTVSYSQRRAARAGWEQGEIITLQNDRGKYIYHLEGDDEFYDLRSDPFELDNLLVHGEAVPAAAEALKDQLLKMYATMIQGSVAIGSGTVDPALMDELRALGYVR